MVRLLSVLTKSRVSASRSCAPVRLAASSLLSAALLIRRPVGLRRRHWVAFVDGKPFDPEIGRHRKVYPRDGWIVDVIVEVK
jgi:hypothetical protein